VQLEKKNKPNRRLEESVNMTKVPGTENEISPRPFSGAPAPAEGGRDGDLAASPDLAQVMRQAKRLVDAMTPAEREKMIEAQARSIARAEARFGPDVDEAAYQAALASGDLETIARLDREAEARVALHD
jgi:hypothetical protein